MCNYSKCAINLPFFNCSTKIASDVVSRDVKVSALPMAIFFTPYFSFLGLSHRDATAQSKSDSTVSNTLQSWYQRRANIWHYPCLIDPDMHSGRLCTQSFPCYVTSNIQTHLTLQRLIVLHLMKGNWSMGRCVADTTQLTALQSNSTYVVC